MFLWIKLSIHVNAHRIVDDKKSIPATGSIKLWNTQLYFIQTDFCILVKVGVNPQLWLHTTCILLFSHFIF